MEQHSDSILMVSGGVLPLMSFQLAKAVRYCTLMELPGALWRVETQIISIVSGVVLPLMSLQWVIKALYRTIPIDIAPPQTALALTEPTHH